MNRKLRLAVGERSNYICEYCGVSVVYFQVDHIVSQRLDGTDDLENLACACIHCNRQKGPLISGLDEAGTEIRLFNPRTQRWKDHFRLDKPEIAGLTPTGKITVQILRMNAPERLEERR